MPSKLAEKLPLIHKRLDDVLAHGDLTHSAARVLEPLRHQAALLSEKFYNVIANPPYMEQSVFCITENICKSSVQGCQSGLVCLLHSEKSRLYVAQWSSWYDNHPKLDVFCRAFKRYESLSSSVRQLTLLFIMAEAFLGRILEAVAM